MSFLQARPGRRAIATLGLLLVASPFACGSHDDTFQPGYDAEADSPEDGGCGSESDSGEFDGIGFFDTGFSDGAPDFDGRSLGVCTGDVAEEIPAPDCEGCFGDYAYALCDGLSYASCACKLPPGYALADAGAAGDAMTDGASRDSGPRDSSATRDGARDGGARDASAKEGGHKDASVDGPG